MSHSCGTDGLSAFHEIVRYGDRRVRAQELLSPFGGIEFSAKKAISLKKVVLQCSCSGGGKPFLLEFAADNKI